MQFKFISAIVAAMLAGSTLAAVLEDRQASTCGSGLAQPCGSVDLTILGIEAYSLDGLTCNTTCDVTLALPGALSGLASVEIDLGVSTRHIIIEILY